MVDPQLACLILKWQVLTTKVRTRDIGRALQVLSRNDGTRPDDQTITCSGGLHM